MIRQRARLFGAAAEKEEKNNVAANGNVLHIA